MEQMVLQIILDINLVKDKLREDKVGLVTDSIKQQMILITHHLMEKFKMIYSTKLKKHLITNLMLRRFNHQCSRWLLKMDLKIELVVLMKDKQAQKVIGHIFSGMMFLRNKFTTLDRVKYLVKENFRRKMGELMVKEQILLVKELAQGRKKSGKVKYLMSGLQMKTKVKGDSYKSLKYLSQMQAKNLLVI